LHELRPVVSDVVADLQANGEPVPEPLAAKKNIVVDLWYVFHPNYTDG